MNKIKSSPAFSIALTISLMVFAVSCTGGAPTLNEAVNYPLAPEEIRSSIQRTLDGKEFKISEREGKVLLLNFWATWCLPCIEEMPDLVKLQKELGPKGFEILGMNTQAESPEDDGMTFEELELQVKEIIKTQKLNYEVVWSSSEAYEKTAEIAKMPVVPLSLLIDADGKVVAVFKGGGKETLEKMIDMSRRAVEDHNAKKAEVKN
jgi:thiol-disulfide isomerase/thioredoxin